MVHVHCVRLVPPTQQAPHTPHQDVQERQTERVHARVQMAIVPM